MLSSASETRNVTSRGKWALIGVTLVVMCGVAFVSTTKEAPATALRITRAKGVALPRKFSDEFDRFDVNGDGVIDEQEFIAVVSAKTGAPMALLNMPKVHSKLDAVFKDVLAMSAPKDASENDLTRQGISRGHVARLIREYGLSLSYDRTTLRSLLHSFLYDSSMEARSDATSSKTTFSPAVRKIGWFFAKEGKPWQQKRAEEGKLKKGARCNKDAQSPAGWCGGYSCGASTVVAKYACCKDSACHCCTGVKDKSKCVWDGSLVEKRSALARLDSVAVGDEVHVGNGDFDTVIYVEEGSLADMLSIEIGVMDDHFLTNTTSLVVTPNHMVVKQNGDHVVAETLHVGDKVGCGSSGKTCVVMGVSHYGKASARSIFLLRSNHFIANGVRTSSFTDSLRVMNALLAAIINPVRWIWQRSNMSRDHRLFWLVKLLNRAFSWTVDPVVRSRTMRQVARDVFGMMVQSS